MLVPRDSEAQLNCSVTEGHRAEWRVQLPDRDSPSETDTFGIANALQSRGFTLQRLGTTALILTVSINEEPTNNNATFVTCIAVDTDDPTERLVGERVQIIFYGMIYPTYIRWSGSLTTL